MADLYTKNGKPLKVTGDDIFDSRGRHVGRRRGDKVYGPDGRYAGTVVGDRVVYRGMDAGSMAAPFARRADSARSAASRAGAAFYGSEPFED